LKINHLASLVSKCVFLKNLVSHESIECFKKQIFSLGFLGQEGLLSVLARFKVGRQVFEKGDSFECWQKVETGCDKVCGYRGQSKKCTTYTIFCRRPKC
jgi:hypothetical protein